MSDDRPRSSSTERLSDPFLSSPEGSDAVVSGQASPLLAGPDGASGEERERERKAEGEDTYDGHRRGGGEAGSEESERLAETETAHGHVHVHRHGALPSSQPGPGPTTVLPQATIAAAAATATPDQNQIDGETLRNAGSMRLGTQTLVQMLNAMGSKYFDDDMADQTDGREEEEDEEEEEGDEGESASRAQAQAHDRPAGRRPRLPPLSSSIHAIHRPVELRRRSTSRLPVLSDAPMSSDDERSRRPSHSSASFSRPTHGPGPASSGAESSVARTDEDDDDESSGTDDGLGFSPPVARGDAAEGQLAPIESATVTASPTSLSPVDPASPRAAWSARSSPHGRADDESPAERRRTPGSVHVPAPPPPRPPPVRTSTSASLTSIRRRRRARLAAKLREVFELDRVEQVVAEHPCWLFRSVLLQGYLYLTTGHICFYAYLPFKEDQVVKSGSLSKKTHRTKRFQKFWMILRNNALSWYESSKDPYFPVSHINLQYALAVEPSARHPLNFKVKTGHRTFVFSADSQVSRDEWIKALRKTLFRCQNEGESVKISIPLETIVDVDRASNLEFANMIRVKVVDGEAQAPSKVTIDAIDEYFFLYFHDDAKVFAEISELVSRFQQERTTTPSIAKEAVQDTTLGRTSTARPSSSSSGGGGGGGAAGNSVDKAVAFSSSPSKAQVTPPLRSLGAPSSPSAGAGAGAGAAARPPPQASASSSSSSLTIQPPSTAASQTVSGRAHPIPVPAPSSRPVPAATTAADARPASSRASLDPPSSEGGDDVTPVAAPSSSHAYPPSAGKGPSPAGYEDRTGESDAESKWPIPSVPQWIRKPTKRALGSSPLGTVSFLGTIRPLLPTSSIRKVSEVWRIAPSLRPGRGVDGGGKAGGGADLDSSAHSNFSLLEKAEAEDKDGEADVEVVQRFKALFPLNDTEELVGHVSGSLYRVLPVPGRIYVSTNYLCFRSTSVLSKTTMVVPIRDLVSVAGEKAFRFGYQALIVVVRGHEEIFLEFISQSKRDRCLELIQAQMDDVQSRLRRGEQMSPSSQGQSEAILLRDLEDLFERAPQPPPETVTDEPIMFRSTSSSFVTFRPQESLHITCLTIGSRGDVQPYIALCKGLQAEGHTMRIATHGEFKDWIQGHGIEFAYVGGDPAELMRICVENGTFTMSFLREGVTKFRGWIDDLLRTSYEACKGTDLLIESPSAMAGIHIAEALRIPYFRAFTMPWTRTRAYPHAFAVPEHKMGGGYNYMTYVVFDQVFWRATATQVNRWRREVLGLPPTNLDKMEQHKVPFLYNFSAHVVPPPLDWPEWIRVTGYWFLDNPERSATADWEPPADLVKFIDTARVNDRKIVYIGFGSIVVSDPDAMTKCVVEAVKESGVYAILSKGWSDRLSTKKVDGEEKRPQQTHEEAEEAAIFPPEIHPIKSVPHDWLFPRIDAACHHGGAGTTGASLRAGIPTIIKPYFGDQFHWANQVESLGVGSCVRKLTVENLASALRTATQDAKQIDKAKLIGEKIRAEDGVARAIECIYRDLEYARTLIKPQAPKAEDTSSTPANDLSTPEKGDEHPLTPPSSSAGRSRFSLQPLLRNAKGPLPLRSSSRDARRRSARSSEIGSPNSPTQTSDEWSVVSADGIRSDDGHRNG